MQKLAFCISDSTSPEGRHATHQESVFDGVLSCIVHGTVIESGQILRTDKDE